MDKTGKNEEEEALRVWTTMELCGEQFINYSLFVTSNFNCSIVIIYFIIM